MKENTYDVVKNLISAEMRVAELESQNAILRRLIDDAEIEFEKNRVKYINSASIHTESIRLIFGWDMCDRAKNARIEREALEALECVTNG